jgi:hypothetical protein
MRTAVYNSLIPQVVLNTMNGGLRFALTLPSARIVSLVLRFFLLLSLFTVAASAATDWNSAEQQLARKIVAITGPGAVTLTIENHSSLSRRDADIIGNGLRSTLGALGLRFVKPDQSAGSVIISLSENPGSYVWVAEVRQDATEHAVAMVSMARPESSAFQHDASSFPLTLRKTSLWSQKDRILDVAVLEENVSPTHIAVLDSEKVSLYRMLGGKWQQEQSLVLTHARPWPRDLRGRLILARDHLFDIYLPGVICRSSSTLPLTLNCRESDDPWPLVTAASAMNGASANFPSFGAQSTAPAALPAAAQMAAFFAPSRNFFTGALAPGIGKFTTVPKFYSAAFLPREKYLLWLFASVDGPVHMVDGVTDLTAKLNWGSDIASVKTSCGAGWQILATSVANENASSIRAYEFPDREPVPVSAAVDFSGDITSLWAQTKGDAAIAISRNKETGDYEAFQLAVACSQ